MIFLKKEIRRDILLHYKIDSNISKINNGILLNK